MSQSHAVADRDVANFRVVALAASCGKVQCNEMVVIRLDFAEIAAISLLES
jgi:hypothetical protein